MGQYELITYLEKKGSWVKKEDIIKDLDILPNNFMQLVKRCRKAKNGYIIESKRDRINNIIHYKIKKGDNKKKKLNTQKAKSMFKYLSEDTKSYTYTKNRCQKAIKLEKDILRELNNIDNFTINYKLIAKKLDISYGWTLKVIEKLKEKGEYNGKKNMCNNK